MDMAMWMSLKSTGGTSIAITRPPAQSIDTIAIAPYYSVIKTDSSGNLWLASGARHPGIHQEFIGEL